tara:strand:+ start:2293 stop:3186 length:894 start_codon:yes stop_codon:yes gene_type:complete
MADAQKYTAGETLCRVLNAGEDALKVDIDNVTLTTEGSDIAIEVHLDKAEDSVLIFGNTNKAGSGTSYVPLVDADGHLQVDTLSSALPSGAATAANQATIIGHVDGVETLLTAANADHAANEALLTTIDADTNAIKVDMAAIEVLITTLDGVQDSALTKLGEIETTNNANQVLLGTIDSDTDAIKTDIAALEVLSTAANADLAEIEVATEATQSSLEKMLYGNALVITAIHGSGSTQSLGATYEALYVGVGGDVVVTMVGTGNFTFKNVASGQLLPIRITHVVNTNTTATNMIALKA